METVFRGANRGRTETRGAWDAGDRLDPQGRRGGIALLSMEETIKGLESDQVRELKQLQEENTQLKRVVADLTIKRRSRICSQKSSEALAKTSDGYIPLS